MSRALPLPIQIYRTGLGLLEPVAAGILAWRCRRGLEERARLPERKGYAGRARPAGPLVWVHGASIGESLALLPLVERIAQRGIGVLVTSGTRTSAGLLARRLPPGAFHQFIPLDVPRYMRRFLDHWRPNLALFAESEIWPNTVLEVEKRGIPLLLVNGRISDRSFRRWQRLPGMIRPLLERYEMCLAQSGLDAERLATLGAPRVTVCGNLKFDTPAPPADPRTLAQLSGLLAGRPVWLAASTHPGEDEIVLEAHAALVARRPGLLTVIAPRHPQRGDEIEALAREAGLAVARRSRGDLPRRETEVYLADTVGEMGLLYRLCPVVLVAGSLVPHGGQNPIEPAKLGAAILHGEHTHNFRGPYAALARAGGAEMVGDAKMLAGAVHRLLADPARTRGMARAAADVVQELGGAVERTMQALEPFIVEVKLAGAR